MVVTSSPSSKSGYRFDLQSIYSQNWHGLKHEVNLAEHFIACRQRNAFAVCGQESWRIGTELFAQDGFTFLGMAPASQSKRGSMGVTITLSRRATAAWERAGREQHVDCGPRMIAVRLEVRCGRRGSQYRRKMGIFLVSA